MKVLSKIGSAVVGGLIFLAGGSGAMAAVIPVGIAAFPGGSQLITFDGLANGTEVNGLTFDGTTFTYTVGGAPQNGQVQIDGGPGTTNNISPPNIVSVGNNSGTLTLTLSGPAMLFGYGFALLASGTIADATTISLFNDSTPVGSLSYAASPDPGFSGDFAGIESTAPFDTVALAFNSNVGLAFALDNIRIAAPVAVPEASTLLLLTSALGLLFIRVIRGRPLG